MRSIKLHVAFVVLAAWGIRVPSPARAEERLDSDAELLRAAKVGTHPKRLVAYLHYLSGNDKELQRVDELVGQLGSESFAAREDASRRLISVGPAVLPALRAVCDSDDAEVRRRARECIRRIEDGYAWAEQLAAVTVLLRQGDGEAAAALLRFLPYAAADQKLQEDIWFGLYDLTKKKPELRKLLAARLEDPLPARRALAGCLLALLGDADQRRAAKALLRDPDPLVRLRTEQGLLGARDAAAVPVLIELLDEPAVEVCWSAEELLYWLAGDGGPKATVGVATPASRQCSRDAWRAWWQKRRGDVDWQQVERSGRRPGLVLVCDRGKCPYRCALVFGRVWLCGCDSKPRWQIEKLHLRSLRLGAGNRLLTLEDDDDSGEGKSRFEERDLQGRVVGNRMSGGDSGFLWLPNGSAIRTEAQRRYVNSTHWAPLTSIIDQYLRNGNRLRYSHWFEKLEGDLDFRLQTYPSLAEITPGGKVLREIPTDGEITHVYFCLGLVRLGLDDPRK